MAMTVTVPEEIVPSITPRHPARLATAILFLPLLVFFIFTILSPLSADAADNLFNSGTAIKGELARLSSEAAMFLKAPVDPYLAQSAAVAGVFAFSYLLDEDINSELSRSHGRVLRGITDFGNAASNPFLHLGVAAAFYGAGAAADRPRVMQLGEEMGEALVLADASTFVLKGVIGRGRPYSGDGNSRYRPFQFQDGYDSLPSMHTASSFAMAHVVASKTDSLGAKIACYATASLAGFSRAYRGKHWASDVVLGAAMGELAGNTVTRYRALQPGQLTLAPLSIDGHPSLALIGKFQ